MSEEEVKEALKLKLSDRLSHNLWKVREQSYKDLASLLQKLSIDESARFEEYQGCLVKLAKDANAAAQLSGLEAIIVFAERAPSVMVKKCAAEVCKAVADKAFTGRPTNKQRGHEAFLAFVYAEAGEQAVEGIATGFNHKTPKVVSACVDSVREAVDIFGINAINVKFVAKLLPPLMEHSNADVRNATKALIVEMYKWLGEAIKPITESFKEVTKRELEATFDEWKGEKPRPKRLTKSKEEKGEDMNQDGSTEYEEKDGNEEEVEQSTDNVLDLAPEIDLLAKISHMKYEIDEGNKVDFYGALNCKKWSVKKQVLDDVSSNCEGKKIINGDFTPLVKELKRILAKEVNVNVTAAASRCAESLAIGLRENFTTYSRLIIAELLSRLKEKNKVLVDAIMSTLKTLFCKKCIQLVDIKEEISTAVSNKVPTARALALQWIDSCLRSNIFPGSSFKSNAKDLASLFIKASEDSTPEVRDAALSCLAALTCLVGENALSSFIDSLDTIRKEKLQHYVSEVPALRGSVNKSRDVVTSKEHQRESHTASTSRTVKRRDDKRMSLQSTRPRLASKTKRHSVAISSGSSNSSKPSKPPKSTSSTPTATKNIASASTQELSVAKPQSSAVYSEQQESQLSEEELEVNAKQLFPNIPISNFSSSDFKERVAGTEELKNAVPELFRSATDVNHVAKVICAVLSKNGGLKDSNAIVVRNKLEILKIVCQFCDNIQPELLKEFGINSVEKLGDLKFSSLATDFLLEAAEIVMPITVAHIYVSKALKDAKNPKLVANIISFLEKLVLEFNVETTPKDIILSFLPSLFENSSPLVRSGATKLAAVLQSKFPNSSIRTALEQHGVKSQLIANIEGELSKLPKDSEVAKRSIRSNVKIDFIHSVENNLGSSFSEKTCKTDITSKVTSKLVNELGDKNWKIRQEALSSVESILRDARFSIEPNVNMELVNALKSRISDTNRNLAAFGLSVLEKLLLSLGNCGSNIAKHILPAVCTIGIADSKKNVREASLACLERCKTEMGLAFLLKNLPPILQQDNAQLRKEILQWILPHLKSCENYKSLEVTETEVLVWVDCATVGIQSKTLEVRQLGEQLLEWVSQQVGVSVVQRQVKAKSENLLTQVKPILERLENGLSESESTQSKSQSSGSSRERALRRPQSTVVTTSMKRNLAVQKSSNSIGKIRENTVGGTPKKRTTSEKSKECVLKRNDGRKNRESRAPKRKPGAAFDTFSTIIIESVHNELKEIVSASLFSKMSAPSFNFKEHLEALEELNSAISEDEMAALDNEDILFRWVALRVNDEGSSSSMLKALEFIANLCSILERHEFYISDYEASFLLPVLCEKFGSLKPLIRNNVKRSYQYLKKILSREKFIPYLIDGLKSKNPRSRMECLEEISIIMEEINMEAFPMETVFHFVEHVFDKDSSISRLAQTILNRIYSNDPGQFWKRVGDISEGQRHGLEERLGMNQLKTPEKRISRQITGSSLQKPKISSANKLSSRQRSENSHGTVNEERQSRESPNNVRESMQTSLPEPNIAEFKLDTKEGTNIGSSSSRIPVISKSSSFRRASTSSEAKNSPNFSEKMKSTEMMDAVKLEQGLDSPVNVTIADSKEFTQMGSPQKNENVASLNARYHRRSRSKSFDALTGLETGNNETKNAMDSELLSNGVQMEENVTNRSSISSDNDKSFPVAATVSSKMRQMEPTQVIDMLCTSETDTQIEGVKSFCLVLQSPSSESLFLPESSTITQILLDHIRNVFDSCAGDEMNIRKLKYFLNGLMQICLRKSFVALLDPQISLCLLDELLTRLLSTQIPLWKDGSQVVRALNLLVLKILENSDRTSLYSVLFELLSKEEDSILRESDSRSVEQAKKKISLIVKCISKLSKTGFSSVNVAMLLRDIHVYLTARCAKKGRKQSIQGDTASESSDSGFQMVTVLLGDLVKIHGSQIWEFTSLIPLETKPVLSRLLQEFLDGKTAPVEGFMKEVLLESPTEPRAPPETVSRESLEKIFERISTKEHTKNGLRELYEFRRIYPDVDLTPYLDATSFVFREYIEKGLESISLEEQHRRGKTTQEETFNVSLSHDIYSQKLEELKVSSNNSSDNWKSTSSYRDRFATVNSREDDDSFHRSNSREISVHLN
ncbi:Cytoskeleton-associated protein 5 [Galdieria sulphuraria]|nr:Cytoskeleton-associated protein 5 [Galdieria sulphuraria]